MSTAPVISLSASIEPLTVVIDTSQTPCDNNSSQSLYVSPTDLHPLPQAGPRKITNRNRKKGSTKILTDTPERDIIAQSKKSKKSRKPPAPKKIRKSLFTKKQKLPTHSDTSESDSDTNSISFDDLSDIDEPNDSDIIEGDFVIVKVSGKSRFQNFIARVDIIDDIEYECVFLKKGPAKDLNDKPYFIINENDEASFMKEDIIVKLPPAISRDGSGRRRDQLIFNIDLSAWNISG